MTAIERALDSDRNAIESLLAANGLPLEGLEIALPTAEAWFPSLGYAPASRTSVPALVMASPEFTSACPDSAAVLHKRL